MPRDAFDTRSSSEALPHAQTTMRDRGSIGDTAMTMIHANSLAPIANYYNHLHNYSYNIS
jgi:hypothetical protein